MALTLSGTNGIVGAGFTFDPSGASVTVGVGTFANIVSPKFKTTGNGADIFGSGASGAYLKLINESATSNASHQFTIDTYNASNNYWNDIKIDGSNIHFNTYTGNRATLSNSALTFASGVNIAMASGNGIDFSATGDGSGSMGSELLDDYEEGTFTPVVADAATGGNTASSYTTSIGWYTKIGNLVNIQMRIRDINQGSISNSSVIYIRGFPYAMEQRSNALVVGHCETSDFNTPSNCHGVSTLTNNGASNPTWCRLFAQSDNATHGVQNFDSIGTTNQIQINMSYRVA